MPLLYCVQILSLFMVLRLIAVADCAEDQCQFSSYKQSASLEASKKKLVPLLGKTYESLGEDAANNKYRFTVGICTEVENPRKDPNLSVMQQKIKEDGTPDGDPFSIGSLKDTHIMTGSDWILLEYRSEKTYGSHCGNEKKRTLIMLTCDETASDGDAKMVYIEEENEKEESCYYLFELKHNAVCPVPVGGGGLSVGSIILIVFISVASCYLLVGFLYSRFVLGAKGMEQFPNYEFWKDFGNLQADGCDLICRTKERRRAGGFGGIGDDQLDPTEEPLRDDNLLPM